MPAQVIQLRPQAHQPAPESFPAVLRQMADQLESGSIDSASIVITHKNGKVETHHSDKEYGSRP